MTDPSASPPKRPPLWRRLLLLFLLTLTAALGIILLFKIKPGFPYLVLIFFAAALLGLVCGLGTRLLLKKRHWLVRSLAATAALFSGLFLLSIFSGWEYGIHLRGLYALKPAVLIQLVVGLLVALLTSLAWRKPAAQIQASTSISPPPPAVHAKPAPRRSRAPRAGKPRLARPSAGVRVTESRRTASRRKPKPPASSRTRSASRPSAPKAARVQESPVVRPAKSRARRRARRPEVQFASTAEHRCPYCLEIVQPHDPRGIVECKICHTLHHADCWAITGTCQVPHLNS